MSETPVSPPGARPADTQALLSSLTRQLAEKALEVAQAEEAAQYWRNQYLSEVQQNKESSEPQPVPGS